MKQLIVREFIEKLKSHPKLSFLLSTAGIWILIQAVFSVVIFINVLYVASRIFNIVLG
jgi:hypothetical protein